MQKFCIISNDLHTVRNFRGELLAQLHQQGYDIHILAPNFVDCPKDMAYFEQQGYQLHAFPLQKMGTNPIADFKTLHAIYKILKQVQPNKVLSYTIKPVIYGTLAAYYAGVKQRFILLSGLGFAFQPEAKTGKFKYIQHVFNQIFKQAVSKASKVIFQNKDDLALIESQGYLKNIPTAVVNGSGVDTEKFNVCPLIMDENQQPAPIFLMVARLLKDKGVCEYINAAKAIKALYPEAQFHLVGWIDANPAAISQIDLDTWVKENIVQFWGRLEDVRPTIAQSNIFVLPSYREGIPRSVLEAMSMGRAIITTDAPGCRETVEEGINGYKVQVACADSLIYAMEKFIQTPKNIAKMAVESRQIILKKYDVRHVNEQMIKEMS